MKKVTGRPTPVRYLPGIPGTTGGHFWLDVNLSATLKARSEELLPDEAN